jgi:Nucleotide modification associated domain 2
MTKLYSYCVRTDDGAAPNPFWGICTLVICKPGIRRTAQIGDWIVGTGSKNAPVGDTSGRLIYAMRVTKRLTMEEYDAFARAHHPNKVPDLQSSDKQRRKGDALYDFSTKPPRVRPGVHGEDAREHDLGGKHALLSTDFYYFGKNAPPVPHDLLPIVRQTQGHQSHLNDPYVAKAIKWLRTLQSGVHGEPQTWEDAVDGDSAGCGRCGQRRSDADDDDDDEEDGKSGGTSCG